MFIVAAAAAHNVKQSLFSDKIVFRGQFKAGQNSSFALRKALQSKAFTIKANKQQHKKSPIIVYFFLPPIIITNP